MGSRGQFVTAYKGSASSDGAYFYAPYDPYSRFNVVSDGWHGFYKELLTDHRYDSSLDMPLHPVVITRYQGRTEELFDWCITQADYQGWYWEYDARTDMLVVHFRDRNLAVQAALVWR